MKKNSSKKIYSHHTEDFYRLIATAVIVMILVIGLIRINAHTFISSKIIVSSDQRPEVEQLNEDDTPLEPTQLPAPSEQTE